MDNTIIYNDTELQNKRVLTIENLVEHGAHALCVIEHGEIKPPSTT